jgi:hypothetical protein
MASLAEQLDRIAPVAAEAASRRLRAVLAELVVEESLSLRELEAKRAEVRAAMEDAEALGVDDADTSGNSRRLLQQIETLIGKAKVREQKVEQGIWDTNLNSTEHAVIGKPRYMPLLSEEPGEVASRITGRVGWLGVPLNRFHALLVWSVLRGAFALMHEEAGAGKVREPARLGRLEEGYEIRLEEGMKHQSLEEGQLLFTVDGFIDSGRVGEVYVVTSAGSHVKRAMTRVGGSSSFTETTTRH